MPFKQISAESVSPVLPADLPILSFLQRPPDGPVVRCLAVGDVGFIGRIGQHANPHEFLQNVAPFLNEADIVFGNLESPILDPAQLPAMFAMSPTALPALEEAGFSILNVANNHIYDYGEAGLKRTLHYLAQTEIEVVGAGEDGAHKRVVYTTAPNGMTIGWLGCGRTLQAQDDNGPVFWEYDPDQLLDAVKQAQASVDILVVSIHIGLMFLNYPDPDHRQVAQQLREAGANLILMHHAHVLQGVEADADERVVCYNLGNFLWDWEEGNVALRNNLDEQMEGAIFLFEFDAQGICLAAALPVAMDECCKVDWATGLQGEKIVGRMKRISEDLNGNYPALFYQQRAERNVGPIFEVYQYHLRRRNWSQLLYGIQQFRPKHASLLFNWFVRKLRNK